MIHYRQCLIYEKAMLQKFISQCLEIQDAFSPNHKVINGGLVASIFYGWKPVWPLMWLNDNRSLSSRSRLADHVSSLCRWKGKVLRPASRVQGCPNCPSPLQVSISSSTWIFICPKLLHFIWAAPTSLEHPSHLPPLLSSKSQSFNEINRTANITN